MEDMKKHFKKKANQVTSHLLCSPMDFSPHFIGTQEHQSSATGGATTEGRTEGVQEELRGQPCIIPFSCLSHSPMSWAKKQEQGEQQRCAQNKKQIKTRKPNQNNTASEAQALHKRRIRSKLGS